MSLDATPFLFHHLLLPISSLEANPITYSDFRCLYKEVQGYWDSPAGETKLEAADDIILLWTDDNWGNVRRVPTTRENKRSGSAGLYFHYDYVGVRVTRIPQKLSPSLVFPSDPPLLHVFELTPFLHYFHFYRIPETTSGSTRTTSPRSTNSSLLLLVSRLRGMVEVVRTRRSPPSVLLVLL